MEIVICIFIILHDFFCDIYQKPFLMKEARTFSCAFLIHVGPKNSKKNSNFFVPSGNELSYVMDISNAWSVKLFAMVYQMLNVLHFMSDIYRVHM